MKSIIFTFTLLLATVFTVNAKDKLVISNDVIAQEEWKEGNFYLLKAGDYLLSLSDVKTDSVVAIKYEADTKLFKERIDLALWEITPKIIPSVGTFYQFKNKRTGAILSFKASDDATPVIEEGIDTWSFVDGEISAKYDTPQKEIGLNVNALGKLSLTDDPTAFSVYAPNTQFVLNADELGDGFKVFRLAFKETISGNIFQDEDLLAEDVADDYVTLQVRGKEIFDDHTPKYLGIDTLKAEIAPATDVYGATFTLDSTRAVVHPNAEWQKFKFLIDLKNDSLNICLAAAPDVNGDLSSVEDVKVVFGKLGANNILTVAQYNEDGTAKQGAIPSVRLKKGNPGSIATGTGIYFLKSASKGELAGKYITAKNAKLVTTDNTPSPYLPEGQWYIKEEKGKYSIADRNTNTKIISGEEIFPVAGMANTFTFGTGKDSITIEYQKDISLSDIFLGTRHFSKEDIGNKGYLLNPQSSIGGVENLFVISGKNNILQIEAGGQSNAVIFKLVVAEDSVKNVDADATYPTGAISLGDTLYHTVYTLKELFTDNFVYSSDGSDALVLTDLGWSEFVFAATDKADEYLLNLTGIPVTDVFVSFDMGGSANLVLSNNNAANFKLVEVDAPEYATIASAHKRLTTNGQSLTMNPFKFLAEIKREGLEITKANYEEENFSLWLERAPSDPEKPLYYIGKGLPIDGGALPYEMYYLASLRDSSKTDGSGNALAGFITRDDIKTMKDSPALFALKITENGGYILESQKELSDNTGAPYIGIVNNNVVMSATGVEFDIEKASAPVANEEVPVVETDVFVTGETGSVIIRNAAGKEVSVINILGQVMTTAKATTNDFTMPAKRGVVFVKIQGEPTQKVLVK